MEIINAEDFAFWDFEADFLNGLLSKFWFAVRQTEKDESGEPKKYKVQSLKTLRYSLNHFLKENGKRHNIITGEKFTGCQTAFDDACKDLKAQGYGFITPTEEIKASGKYFLVK